MEKCSLSDFEIVGKLGQGSYSSVYLVRSKSTGLQFAMKKVRLDNLNENERNNTLNEIRFLASLNSPYIVSYKGAFYDDLSKSLCIIMEFVDGGDLLQKIRESTQKKIRIQENVIWSYAIQMIKGMKTLHNLKILHRDLKSANIFISKDGKYAKIGDLNVAVIAKQGTVHTQTGTPYYASPEVWRDDPYNNKSDIWSLGCVLYEMACGKPPFCAKDMQGLYKLVQKGQYEPLPEEYSADLARLIGQCLNVVADRRPSCEDLLNDTSIIQRIDLDPMLAADSSMLDEVNSSLLKTIKFPKNLRLLANILPRPKIKKSDSMNNLQQSSNQPSVARDASVASKECPVVQAPSSTKSTETQQINGQKAQPRSIMERQRSVSITRARNPSREKDSSFSKGRSEVNLLRRPENSQSKKSLVAPILLKKRFSQPKIEGVRSITPLTGQRKNSALQRTPIRLSDVSNIRPPVAAGSQSRGSKRGVLPSNEKRESSELIGGENCSAVVNRRHSSILLPSRSRRTIKQNDSKSILVEKSAYLLNQAIPGAGNPIPAIGDKKVKKAFNNICSLVMEQRHKAGLEGNSILKSRLVGDENIPINAAVIGQTPQGATNKSDQKTRQGSMKRRYSTNNISTVHSRATMKRLF